MNAHGHNALVVLCVYICVLLFKPCATIQSFTLYECIVLYAAHGINAVYMYIYLFPEFNVLGAEPILHKGCLSDEPDLVGRPSFHLAHSHALSDKVCVAIEGELHLLRLSGQ